MKAAVDSSLWATLPDRVPPAMDLRQAACGPGRRAGTHQRRGGEVVLAWGNIFADVPDRLADEQFTTLLSAPNVSVERIVSTGQASPPDHWYDQDRAEWVIVLAGSAGLLFEGEAEPRIMRPGDYVHIPAHKRHRVAWTDPAQPTVWLAVHHG